MEHTIFRMFFKRKSDQSNVLSLKILSPRNLEKDQSASIYRIESPSKTDYNVDACKWFIGGEKEFSSPFNCQQKTFSTEQESTHFIAKFFKKPVKKTKENLESSSEFVGAELENFSYPSWLDLEFDHQKTIKIKGKP